MVIPRKMAIPAPRTMGITIKESRDMSTVFFVPSLAANNHHDALMDFMIEFIIYSVK